MENDELPLLTLLEGKQAMLAAIIESTDDTIISKNLEGIITSWNPAAQHMFGYSEIEAIGKHISLIIPDDRLDEETFIIGEVVRGNRINHFETIRRAKNGRLIPISLTISPIKNRSGKIIGASKIARDITERREAAQKQGMLAAIIDTSDDTILSKTLDGIITSWNKAAVKMFGYTEGEAIGQHISLIIPTERLDEEIFIINQVRQGKKVDHFQTLRRAKDGKLIPISLSVSPVTDSNGQVIGASKIARDISGEQTAQQEMARLYEQLKELNVKKDEFIGLASHELKTPLTSMKGYLQILAQRVTDEKNKLFVQKTQQQVDKLNALVDDLLDVSKMEAGKLKLNIDDFDMCQVIADAVDLISHANDNYSIRFNAPVSKCATRGDAHRIEQVIINFLTNAIRYSTDNQDIEVFLIIEGGGIKVGVKDNGIGIPAEKLGDIFSRYYRVVEGAMNVSGLGLGLYLCHEIITRHDGKIWADSELGKGSTFWFTLPS